jgi:hypothetical protein
MDFGRFYVLLTVISVFLLERVSTKHGKKQELSFWLMQIPNKIHLFPSSDPVNELL